ncbi:MAG: hypothetical protein LBU77_01045 [Clostridiales bacterium]|jgi:hypothetical protein|nr:hypothetical protein [Clostridiales bacterium]
MPQRFFEDYQRKKQENCRPRDRPAMINKGFGTAVLGFFQKLFTAVLYLLATVLSSIGLTVLLNKPLRDMLFELALTVFFGGAL